MNNINLYNLPKTSKDRKRVGRGSAAGGGTTAGRGTKGQKARTGSSIPAHFEGGQLPITQRLPKKRGTPARRLKYRIITLNVGHLSDYAEGDKLTVEALRKRGVLRSIDKLKILGDGEMSGALTIEAHLVSGGAKKKIEAAGGKITIIETHVAKRA